MTELSWLANPIQYTKTCLMGLPFVNAVYYKNSPKDKGITWYIDHEGYDYIIAVILFQTQVIGSHLEGDHTCKVYQFEVDEEIRWCKLN